jgi:hypothetical protein
MKTIIDLPKDIQKLAKEFEAKKKQLLTNVGVIARLIYLIHTKPDVRF